MLLIPFELKALVDCPPNVFGKLMHPGLVVRESAAEFGALSPECED